MVAIIYERLPVLNYGCGLVGHEEVSCQSITNSQRGVPKTIKDCGHNGPLVSQDASPDEAGQIRKETSHKENKMALEKHKKLKERI